MNNFKVLPAIFLFFISVESLCQLPLFDKQMQVSFDEKQGQFVALDTKLVNEKGDTVLLKDVLDKPAILNLVYYECAGTCSPLMFGV
jgi:cytochrome oxidase Cu insertion factor (SCO1/SenC/PrrC family)